MDIRCVSKKFKCDNCNKRFKKLVNYIEEKTVCEECGGESFVIEENEFNREEADRTYRMAFDHSNLNEEMQYHPRTDILDRDPNNLYGDPRSRHRQHAHVMQGQQPSPQAQRQRTQAQPQRVQAYPQRAQAEPQPDRQGIQPSQSTRPRRFIYREIYMPYIISPFNGSVRRHPAINIFSMFGSFFNMPSQDFFMDNFASNFTSNFEDPLTRIVFLQSMQNQPSGTPPASKESIKLLKKFKMTEEFCKKDEKGNLEYPSCSVCLTELAQGEETVIIPCGHMFHDPCIMKWLGMHNTCPVCRYELPTEDPDYERIRQQRSNGQSNAHAFPNSTYDRV